VFKLHQQPAGQSLTEYVLPVCLVGMVALVMWQTMDANNLFQTAVSNGNHGKIVQRQLQVNTLASGVQSPTLPAQSSGFFPSGWENIPGRDYVFTLADGITYRVPTKNPEDLYEVAGFDGQTQNALATLDAFIAQLVANDPEGDDPRIPALKELSKRGHRIADAQALIESMLPPGGFAKSQDRYAFLEATQVMFEGKQVSLLDVAGSLNFFYGLDDNFNRGNEQLIVSANKSFWKHSEPHGKMDHNNPINSFMIQMNEMRDSSVLKQDPVLSTLVNDILANQIFYSSVNTLYAPDKVAVDRLQEKSETRSEDLCRLSNHIKCQ
jgi:hypothetical protein